MNILIIEDEKLSADRIKRLLNDIDDTMDVSGPLTDVDAVAEHLKGGACHDLILSDIRLKGRLVFEAFHDTMPSVPVIFTTAYDEYALSAFKHNGIDYLLKPITQEDLSAAIAKARRFISTQNEEGTAIHLSGTLNAAARELKCFRERMLVTKGDELIPLRVTDISFIRKEDNWVMAYDRHGEAYRLSVTMNKLEEQLNPEYFFRLNRQYIAHIDCIHKISFFFSSKLIVRLQGCDDDHIVVSKEKSAQFKQWLDR